MIGQFKAQVFCITLLLVMTSSGSTQNAQDVGAVLRAVAARVPEIGSLVVRPTRLPYQNSWSASSPIFNISVDVSGSLQEAEWRASRSQILTSVSYDRDEIFNGSALYIWEKYGSLRIAYQTGTYVIDISARDGDPRVGIHEPLARRVLEQLVRELESVAPKRQVLRARDIPSNQLLALSWGPQSGLFKENNPEVIPWEDAQFILTNRKLKGGKQYPTRWLTILCADGSNFLTWQPELDAYVQWGKARAVDLTGFTSAQVE
jgi:hypothetical protein